jgi:hypothetical protein
MNPRSFCVAKHSGRVNCFEHGCDTVLFPLLASFIYDYISVITGMFLPPHYGSFDVCVSERGKHCMKSLSEALKLLIQCVFYQWLEQ